MLFEVSVVIPAYKAEQFLRTAVESVVHLPEAREVLIIEDGSPDNTLELSRELVKQYPNVFLFQHPDKKNHGVSASRNLGIEKANCDFIAFLDADDYFLPNRFTKDKEILLTHPSIDGVYNALGIQYYSELGKDRFIKSGYQYQEFFTLSSEVHPEELFYVLFNQHPYCKGEFSGDALTVRKSIFLKSGYFPIYLKLQEDTHLWRRMAATCNLASGNIKEAVAIRGVHDNNTMVNHSIQPDAQQIWWEDLHCWLKKERVNIKYLECFRLSYLLFKLKINPTFKNVFPFIYFFIRNPQFIKQQYGPFDSCFLDIFGRNWICLHAISFKNKLFRAKN
jgi:glycosyltransferase involved in cell wall biosynthesis